MVSVMPCRVCKGLPSQAFVTTGRDAPTRQVRILSAARHAPQTPQAWVENFDGYGVAELTAGVVRTFHRLCPTRPLLRSLHTATWPAKTKQVQNGLRDSASILVFPSSNAGQDSPGS